MIGAGWGLAAVLVAWAAVALWRSRRERREGWGEAAPRGAGRGWGHADDGIDHEALRQAEREVRDLRPDVTGGALEDQPGDDWGPGVPGPRG